MSGTRKIKISADFQRVQWKTRNTRRGVINKQIVVYTKKARSAPSTPSKRAMSTDEQQYFDGDPSEPLIVPTGIVCFLPIEFIHLK
jgi:hypothetical protein